MKKCTNNTIISSTTNLVVPTDNILDFVNIKLYSNGGFNSNYATSPDYDNQYLQVKVRGEVKL